MKPLKSYSKYRAHFRSWAMGLLCLAGAPVLFSCNFYGPLSFPASDSDFIEEARHCLHAGDYACAVQAYERIGSAGLRDERLCVVQVAQAGLGLPGLVSTMTNSQAGQSFLGAMATSLIPFSDEKLEAATQAVVRCAAVEGPVAPLLKAVSLLVDCAVRIARTDLRRATADGGAETCNASVAGNQDGQITAADIGGDPVTGALSAGAPGMCSADVRVCVDNLAEVSALGADLTGAGLTALVLNIDDLPAELVDGSTATDLARQSLRGTVQ